MPVTLPDPDSDLYLGIVAALHAGSDTRDVSKLYKVGQGVVQGIAKACRIQTDGVNAGAGAGAGAGQRKGKRPLPTPFELAPDVRELAREAILRRLRVLAGRDEVATEMGSMKTKAIAYEVKTLAESFGSVLEVVKNGDDKSDSGADRDRVLQAMGLDAKGPGEE